MMRSRVAQCKTEGWCWIVSYTKNNALNSQAYKSVGLYSEGQLNGRFFALRFFFFFWGGGAFFRNFTVFHRKKLYSDFSYTLACFSWKCKRNRILHPCQDLFDFYEQALLRLNVFCPKRVAYLRSVVQSRSVHIRVNNCSHAIEKHKNRLQTLKKADIILETVAHFHGQILVYDYTW